MHRILIVLLVICMVPASAREIAADEISPGRMQSGSLLLKMKTGYVVATRMNTAVEARVTGVVARVSVHQEFRNDGQDWVEGVYVFPLPDQAAVDHLRLRIGERIIEGEIREKEQARKDYEAARESGRKASLVEQQRANMFTTSVANIAPGETVIVEIDYLEPLRYDDGTFSLRFPLTLTPRYIPGEPLPDRKGTGWSADTSTVADASLITPPVIVRSADHRLTFTAELNVGVPLQFVASRYHRIDVSSTGNRYRIVLADSSVPMDQDLELTWRPVADATPRALLFTEEAAGAQHALLMMLPPDEFSAPMQSLPRELILVIDTSGSMHGTSLEQAQSALGMALGGLGPRDRFNIIQFNSVTSSLFSTSVDATMNNIAVARRFISGLTANGGTEMLPAIEQALSAASGEGHLRQVIFITDGSVGNEEALFALIEQRLGAARLFTVGIGSAPNSWFMRKAAEAGRGTFTMIGALHEVDEKMGRLFRKLEQPQVTDISVTWPGGNDAESHPGVIPDLYAGEPIVVRTRLPSGLRAGGRVRIHGKSALGAWQAEIGLDAAEQGTGIAALWARGRIEWLLDRLRRGADEAEIRAAIVDTALSHHLVSKYTSLVAIDRTPARSAADRLVNEQVPNLLPYGQSHEAIFGFPGTATGAAAHRVIGIALLAAAFLGILLQRSRTSGHAAARET